MNQSVSNPSVLVNSTLGKDWYRNTRRMTESELGLDQFKRMNQDKQALAMFRILEENRTMLKQILSSEISSCSSSLSDHSSHLSSDHGHTLPKFQGHDLDTVHLNVGGGKFEVILFIDDLEVGSQDSRLCFK